MYTDPFEILQKSAPTAPKEDLANTSNIVPGVTKSSGMEQSNASKQSSKYKRKYHEHINILLLHYIIFINLFFLGHDQDAKSLQGENPAGVASGGDDETETEIDAPENPNIMGSSTNTTTTVLPRYYYNLIIT